MTRIQEHSGRVRSADALNQQIRDLWLRTGGRLTAEERRTYEMLVTQWAAAVRGDARRW